MNLKTIELDPISIRNLREDGYARQCGLEYAVADDIDTPGIDLVIHAGGVVRAVAFVTQNCAAHIEVQPIVIAGDAITGFNNGDVAVVSDFLGGNDGVQLVASAGF